MTGTELAQKIQKGIEEGIITTYKTLEEDHKISRSTINAWVNDGKYAKSNSRISGFSLKSRSNMAEEKLTGNACSTRISWATGPSPAGRM